MPQINLFTFHNYSHQSHSYSQYLTSWGIWSNDISTRFHLPIYFHQKSPVCRYSPHKSPFEGFLTWWFPPKILHFKDHPFWGSSIFVWRCSILRIDNTMEIWGYPSPMISWDTPSRHLDFPRLTMALPSGQTWLAGKSPTWMELFIGNCFLFDPFSIFRHVMDDLPIFSC